MEIILLIQLIILIILGYNIYLTKKENRDRLDFQIRMEKKFREVIEKSGKLARELLSCKKKHSIKMKK